MEQAQLRILSGPLKGQAFPLLRKSVEIGRGSGCDIKPQGYDELGRHHARLTWENNAFEVVDLGSLNGVKVDGERVTTGRLRNGSTVQFGDLVTELWIPPGGPTFQDAPAPVLSPAPPPAPRTRILSPALVGAGALAALLVVLVIAGASGAFHAPGATASGASGSAVSHPSALNELSPDILAATKASTVLVWSKFPGTDQKYAHGSGFCAFHKDWIITNTHVVVVPKMEDGQPVTENGNWVPEIGDVSIVINSGTNEEQVVNGVVAKVDPDHDLAIIHIGSASLTPLPIGDANALHETQTCYAFGFPAVRTEDIRQSNPAISVQAVSIEALRLDDFGHLKKIQMGGTVTHGNSGGPVVNADGQVIGVAREAAREDIAPGDDPQKAAGISYAIPSHELVNLEKAVDQ